MYECQSNLNNPIHKAPYSLCKKCRKIICFACLLKHSMDPDNSHDLTSLLTLSDFISMSEDLKKNIEDSDPQKILNNNKELNFQSGNNQIFQNYEKNLNNFKENIKLSYNELINNINLLEENLKSFAKSFNQNITNNDNEKKKLLIQKYNFIKNRISSFNSNLLNLENYNTLLTITEDFKKFNAEKDNYLNNKNSNDRTSQNFLNTPLFDLKELNDDPLSNKNFKIKEINNKINQLKLKYSGVIENNSTNNNNNNQKVFGSRESITVSSNSFSHKQNSNKNHINNNTNDNTTNNNNSNSFSNSNHKDNNNNQKRNRDKNDLLPNEINKKQKISENINKNIFQNNSINNNVNNNTNNNQINSSQSTSNHSPEIYLNRESPLMNSNSMLTSNSLERVITVNSNGTVTIPNRIRLFYDVRFYKDNNPELIIFDCQIKKLYKKSILNINFKEINDYNKGFPFRASKFVNVNNSLYLTGGYDLNNKLIGYTYKIWYDIHDNKVLIKRLKDMKIKRDSHNIVYLPQKNSILVCSGNNELSAEILELSKEDNNDWKRINNLNEVRQNATIFIANENFVYVIGGYDSPKGKYLNSYEMIKIDFIENNVWKNFNFNNIDLAFCCMGVIPKEKNSILLLGGYKGGKSYRKNIFEIKFNVKNFEIEQYKDDKVSGLRRGILFYNSQTFINFNNEKIFYNFDLRNQLISFNPLNKLCEVITNNKT